MDWKTGNDLKIFSCYPYRIEKVREKYKLYRYTRVPIDGRWTMCLLIEKVREKYKLYRYTRVPIDGRWTMCLLGKFEHFEDAAKAAEDDKKQGRLF